MSGFDHTYLTSFTDKDAATLTMLRRSTSNSSILSTASTASDSVSTANYKLGQGDSGDRYQVVNLLIDQLESSLSCSLSSATSSLSSSLSIATSRRASSPPSLQDDTDFACCAEVVQEAVQEARRMWVPAEHQHQTSAETPTPSVRRETHPWSFASGLAYAPPHAERQQDPKLAALVDALDPQDFCFEELRRSLIAAGLQEHSRPIPHFI